MTYVHRHVALHLRGRNSELIKSSDLPARLTEFLHIDGTAQRDNKYWQVL